MRERHTESCLPLTRLRLCGWLRLYVIFLIPAKESPRSPKESFVVPRPNSFHLLSARHGSTLFSLELVERRGEQREAAKPEETTTTTTIERRRRRRWQTETETRHEPAVTQRQRKKQPTINYGKNAEAATERIAKNKIRKE